MHWENCALFGLIGDKRPGDSFRCDGWRLMLPHTKDMPAERQKIGVSLEIALLVARDLGSPIDVVRARWLEVSRTRVPETSINEDCQPVAGEDHVCATAQGGYRAHTDAIAQPAMMEHAPQCKLRDGAR